MKSADNGFIIQHDEKLQLLQQENLIMLWEEEG